MAPTPLILAGGKSTRMNSPKHLLHMPDGRPLYQHQVDVLARACPQSPVIYMSLAQDSQLDNFLQDCAAVGPSEKGASPAAAGPELRVIFDQDANQTAASAGPAAGLLAAFASDPRATWLTVPCDSPFINAGLLSWLHREYEPPVTCYRNDEGFCEPLIGIWSPEALVRLAQVAKSGKVGPSAVVRKLGGKQIELPVGDGRPLVDVNTREEWDAVFETLRETAR